MSVLQAIYQNLRSFGTVPGAPTIGTVPAISLTTASVPFTAPASNGGSPITSYTATSTPGSITGVLSQAGSGTITVSGLASGTSYTFKVKATNAIGTGPESAASNSITTVASSTPTVEYLVLAGGAGGGGGSTTRISATWGGAGGGAGGLRSASGFAVASATPITVTVGGGGNGGSGATAIGANGTSSVFSTITTVGGGGGGGRGTASGGGPTIVASGKSGVTGGSGGGHPGSATSPGGYTPGQGNAGGYGSGGGSDGVGSGGGGGYQTGNLNGGGPGGAGPGTTIMPSASSTSTHNLGFGTKTFTVASGLVYAVGDILKITYDSSNYIFATVSSYSGTSLVVTTTTKQPGTFFGTVDSGFVVNVSATISSTTITVNSVISGTVSIGALINYGGGIRFGAYITAFGTGTGGAGTYIVNIANESTISGATRSSNSGVYSNWTITYAFGGGGGGSSGISSGGGQTITGGMGGGGGGAQGGALNSGAVSALANTGGGGGGQYTNTGGAGGSGIVMIRYANTYTAASATTGTVTVYNVGGYRIYKWTSSGSITF